VCHRHPDVRRDDTGSAEDGHAAVEMAERITIAVREQGWGKGLAEGVQTT